MQLFYKHSDLLAILYPIQKIMVPAHINCGMFYYLVDCMCDFKIFFIVLCFFLWFFFFFCKIKD